ncbi:MAG: hypothetical protein ABL875_04070 [Candidatus Nitrotoga sp.]
MSRYRRAKTAGSSYFFTVVAYRRQSILCDEAIRNALRASIETVRVARPFVTMHGYCCLTIYIACGHYLTVMPIFPPVG